MPKKDIFTAVREDYKNNNNEWLDNKGIIEFDGICKKYNVDPESYVLTVEYNDEEYIITKLRNIIYHDRPILTHRLFKTQKDAISYCERLLNQGNLPESVRREIKKLLDKYYIGTSYVLDALELPEVDQSILRCEKAWNEYTNDMKIPTFAPRKSKFDKSEKTPDRKLKKPYNF